jgi:predicted ABC-type ATPase
MSERPRLLVVAGANGAGKTTVTERGLAHTWFAGSVYINPDFIARDEFGDWNDPTAVLRAAEVATGRRWACLDRGESLSFETVFSAPDKVEFVREARRRGYFCRLFYVGTTSPTINAARIARRVMQGGHDVPIRKVVDRYVASLANCAQVAAEVDRLYLYDNSLDDCEPRLLLRASEGTVTREYSELPLWAREISAGLEPVGG